MGRIDWAVSAGRLTSDEAERLHEFEDRLKDVMRDLGQDESHWGPIHGDLGFWGNCVFHEEVARPIDFNSSVMAHFAFEVGHTACWTRNIEYRSALFEGYATERTLPDTRIIETMFLASRLRHLSGFVMNPNEDLVKERRFINEELGPYLQGESILMRKMHA